MLSRSALALAAFALLASGGVMAAAGPDMNKRNDGDSSFSLRVDLNNRDWSGGRHRGTPRPVFAEVAPHALELQAFQAGDTVILLARGENTTAGFTTSLERDRAGSAAPDHLARVILRNYGPVHRGHSSAQVCTPFAISGSFKTREDLNEIRVWIDGSERCVPVQRIDQMRRTN